MTSMGEKTRIPRKAAELKDKTHPRLFSAAEKQFLGISESTENTEQSKSSVVLKYYFPSVECFSEWDRDDLKAFSNFIEKMNQRTWAMIYSSGGHSGNKLGNGLGYKLHKDPSKLPRSKEIIQRISEDITFFELRCPKTDLS